MCGVIILKPLNNEIAYFYLLCTSVPEKRSDSYCLQPSYLLVQTIFAPVLFQFVRCIQGRAKEDLCKKFRNDNQTMTPPSPSKKSFKSKQVI